MIEKYTSDMILARLQAGESVEAIAKELTAALNDANDKYAAEAARRAEAQKLFARKADAIGNLIDAIADVCKVWDLGDDILEALASLDPEDIAKEIDEAMPAIQEYEKAMNAFKAQMKSAPEPERNSAPARSADPIEDFLNKFVRN